MCYFTANPAEYLMKLPPDHSSRLHPRKRIEMMKEYREYQKEKKEKQVPQKKPCGTMVFGHCIILERQGEFV